MLLSCAAKARESPLGENDTECTHPAELFRNSPQTVLKGSLSPQTPGAGRASLPLMKVEKTRAWTSVEPAARRTELGCQATEVMVLRMGFLRCFDTHQSFSSSK